MSDLYPTIQLDQVDATPTAISIINCQPILLLVEARELQQLEMDSGYKGHYYSWQGRVYLYWDGEMTDGFIGTDLAAIQAAVRDYYGYEPGAPRSRNRYVMTGEGQVIRYTETINGSLPAGAVRAEQYDTLTDQAYHFEKGIILQYSNTYTFFERVDHYLAYTNRFNRSIAYGFNPYGKQFPWYGLELRDQLAAALGFSPDQLDFSPDSLVAIDRKLMDVPEDDIFYYENLLALVSYLGEVYIRNHGGEWYMQDEGDGVTWFPRLLKANGQEAYRTFSLWKQIYEEETAGICLQLAYRAMVDPPLIGAKSEEPLQPR